MHHERPSRRRRPISHLVRDIAPEKSTDPEKPTKSTQRQFLTPGLALSMFFVWVFAGFASPASMVRVMAAQNTEVMRKSIFLLSCYNCLIYIPLIMSCIAARTLLPDLGTKSDEVIPRLSLLVTKDFPFQTGQFVSGLILAAPFGAIMASVSCFVLVIASGLVEDIYAKFINPNATELQMRRATTISMVAVGVVAVLAVINPPQYLQALVVLSGSAGAATFIAPVMMACYWRRGPTLAGAAGRACWVVSWSILGSIRADGLKTGPRPIQRFRYRLRFSRSWGTIPKSERRVCFGRITSSAWIRSSGACSLLLFCGIGVSLATRPPSARIGEEVLRRTRRRYIHLDEFPSVSSPRAFRFPMESGAGSVLHLQ